MTISDALEILQGKLDCMKKCDVFDCKNSDECDNCKYHYAQGTYGEQKKAFELILNYFKPNKKGKL